MGALVLALVIWRVDVVRLLPQTAAFYKMVGLDGEPARARVQGRQDHQRDRGRQAGAGDRGRDRRAAAKNRSSCRGCASASATPHGAEIYAWNAVLEQAVLKPGEKAWFKSRLASPPPEGRNIDVRFFNKRDIAGGNA